MKVPALLVRRTILVPTFAGWLLIVCFLIFSFVGFGRGVYPFLSPNKPVGGEILVLEGWAADLAVAEALEVFRTGKYRFLATTGGPLERGSYLKEHATHAEVAAATLKEIGFEDTLVRSVSAPPVARDRTFASAVALRAWMQKTGEHARKIDLLSIGPHARRSRLLFQKAFGNEVEIGIIALSDPEYDANSWWRSSEGVRDVIGESIAYLYARFLFRAQL